MKKLNNTFFVNKNDNMTVDSAMKIIFSIEEDNKGVFNNIYKIIEWNMGEWIINKGVKHMREDFYIYVESLPDFFKAYTVENEKYLRVRVKHKMKVDEEGFKKIKSRFSLKNLKPGYRSIVNGFELIKIINYMEIADVPNTKLLNININTNINLTLPSKNEIEDYLLDVFNVINENFKTKLTNAII
jgi:DNA-binding cell septation regulator SpoVG